MGRVAETFTKTGATTLTFDMPPRSRFEEIGGDQAPRSAGDQTYAYDTGIGSTNIVLEWLREDGDVPANPLKPDVYDGSFNHSTRAQTGGTQSLLGWKEAISKGMQNTFTYTKWNGNTYTVRFMEDSINLIQGDDLMYYGQVILRVER